MKKVGNIFGRHPFPIFILLSCLLSWWSAPFANGSIIPYGPSVAALIVIALTAGKPGLRAWWRRVTNWRAAGYWYLVAPAIIIGYQGAAYYLNILFGATVASPPVLPSLALILQLAIIGGQWEEPGWSGYALPILLDRYANRKRGALIAVLILGVYRAIWHLPLFLYGHIPWFDIFIFAIAFQFIIAWLYIRSGGSVPVVMLFHFISNLLGAVMSPVFAGADRTSYYALFMGLASLVAVVIALFTFTKNGLQNLPAISVVESEG